MKSRQRLRRGRRSPGPHPDGECGGQPVPHRVVREAPRGGHSGVGRDAVNARDDSYVAFVAARQSHFRRIAYAICGDWSTADDVLQDALIKLYLARPRVRRDGREEAYLRQIIVRADVDRRRRPWRREQHGELPDRAGRDVSAQVDDHDELFRALQQLPLMQRKVVILRHWLELSVEQTAEELNISEGTVKSHSSRALERLRSVLGRPASHASADVALSVSLRSWAVEEQLGPLILDSDSLKQLQRCERPGSRLAGRDLGEVIRHQVELSELARGHEHP